MGFTGFTDTHVQFLAIFLVTAAYCPDRQRYLDDMAKLDEGTQNQLGELIKLVRYTVPYILEAN